MKLQGPALGIEENCCKVPVPFAAYFLLENPLERAVSPSLLTGRSPKSGILTSNKIFIRVGREDRMLKQCTSLCHNSNQHINHGLGLILAFSLLNIIAVRKARNRSICLFWAYRKMDKIESEFFSEDGSTSEFVCGRHPVTQSLWQTSCKLIFLLRLQC